LAKAANGKIDEQAQIEWGKANKPVNIKYLAGEETFAYNSNGHLVEHTQKVGTQQFSLKYEIDSQGRIASRTLPSGV
jgi:YD repeat-containing protein